MQLLGEQTIANATIDPARGRPVPPATAGEQTEVRRPGGWTLSLERVS